MRRPSIKEYLGRMGRRIMERDTNSKHYLLDDKQVVKLLEGLINKIKK